MKKIVNILYDHYPLVGFVAFLMVALSAAGGLIFGIIDAFARQVLVWPVVALLILSLAVFTIVMYHRHRDTFLQFVNRHKKPFIVFMWAVAVSLFYFFASAAHWFFFVWKSPILGIGCLLLIGLGFYTMVKVNEYIIGK